MNEFYLRNNRRIIDSFIFFNEFDMLKLRLDYLNEVVDYFVICESNYTFSGKEKPYYLDEVINDIPENIRQKIIRIKYEPDITTFNFPDNVTGYDYENDYWRLEKEQRDFIGKNLSAFSVDDFMMLSDVDEIPSKEVILKLFNELEGNSLYVAKCDFLYYNFRTFLHDDWLGTVFSTVQNFIQSSSEYLRNQRHLFSSIEKSGWHFSYFSDIEQIKKKIDSFSHQEYNNGQYKNDSNIIDSIKNKRYLFDKEYTFKDYNFNNLPQELRTYIMKYFPKEYYITVFVFGSNGMLGKYLTKYLSPYFEVVPITRNEVDLNDDFSKIEEKYNFQETDVVINAAGIIKQRDYSAQELIRVNSLFPHFLSTLGCNIIHITTDCIFSGKDGSYNEDALHDCLDDYGKSKSLGECKNLTIIRTSIIGEELQNKKSLIEWVKSNRNTKINGYLNHFWNGVTCLELSKHIKDIIQNSSYWKGVRHYHSPYTVSKYQLVSYINDVYELNNEVVPAMSSYCDRSLSTIYNSPVEKTIKEQIVELKSFTLDKDENKLKNFPTINYVSLRENEERRKVLHQTFQKYGIKKISPHIYERYSQYNHQVDVGSIYSVFMEGQPYLGAITSHFKAIKEWYNNTDEEYALFCEDDLGFDAVEYWNFNWEDFFSRIPSNWQCVQLSLSRAEGEMFRFFQPEVHFRNRCWCDFSCVAYLIKRSHAERLINDYYSGDNFYFGYKGIDIDVRDEFAKIPTIETLIYTVFEYNTVFTFPLFVENRQFNTSVWNKDKTDYCYDSIMDWWKTRGKTMDLKEIFGRV